MSYRCKSVIARDLSKYSTRFFSSPSLSPQGMLKQWRRRRQRERQKATTLHILCRHCTTKKWKRLILSFVEDVNTRRLSFPFPEIRYSLLEFNSTKKANIWKARWSLKQRDYPFKWCFRSRRRCRTVTSLITQTQRHSLAKNVLTPNARSDLNSTEWPGFDITRHSFSITTNCCKSADAHLYYTPLICSRIILFHNIDWRLQISKTSQDVHYFCKANTRLGSTVMHQITTLRPQMIPFCLIY